ncbi:MAG: DUF2939 domain-containing protein [Phascolarctobacterium sp.]|nr:DUF2939 domain-containing protein [Phascolarctobacterium sp.]
MSKKLIFLVVVLIALLGAAGYYFLYFTKTPAYSIYQAYDAAKNHNLAKFEEHVDINSVYANAYDQIAEKTVAQNPTLDKLFGGVKDYVVDQLATQTRKSIAGKKDNEVTEAPAKEKGNILDVFNASSKIKDAEKDYMERHLNFKYMRFKDISTTELVDGSAIVTGKFHDIQVDKDFFLKLKMVPNANGQWKVTQIMNAVDIALERDKAASEKLAQLNKNIRDEMARVFVVQDAKAEVKKGGGFIPTSKFVYTIAYTLPDKNTRVAELEGEFTMLNPQGQVAQRETLKLNGLLVKYAARDYAADKVYTETFTKRDIIGTLFGRERGIVDKGVENYTCEFALEKMILADGKVLQAITKLPEPKS